MSGLIKMTEEHASVCAATMDAIAAAEQNQFLTLTVTEETADDLVARGITKWLPDGSLAVAEDEGTYLSTEGVS